MERTELIEKLTQRILARVFEHRKYRNGVACDCGDCVLWRDVFEALSAVPAPLAGPSAPTADLPDEAVKRDLSNCYMMAKREIARITNGKAACDATSLERWQHVKRFCESVGEKSTILRWGLPTELTDGAEALSASSPVTSEQKQRLLDAAKMLTLVLSPCGSDGSDHTWRTCPRCLAEHELEARGEGTWNGKPRQPSKAVALLRELAEVVPSLLEAK